VNKDVSVGLKLMGTSLTVRLISGPDVLVVQGGPGIQPPTEEKPGEKSDFGGESARPDCARSREKRPGGAEQGVCGATVVWQGWGGCKKAAVRSIRYGDVRSEAADVGKLCCSSIG